MKCATRACAFCQFLHILPCFLSDFSLIICVYQKKEVILHRDCTNNMETKYLIYLICYFVLVCHFTALGLYMTHKARHNDVEPANRWNIRWAAVVYLFAWVVNTLVYLPAIVLDGFESTNTYYYNTCFLINISISTAVTMLVLHTLIQQNTLVKNWTPGILVMGIGLVLTYIFTREIGVLYAGYVMVGYIILQLLLTFSSDYRQYTFRLKTEYSDLSGHEIKWSWYTYFGFVLQITLYMIYQACFNIVLEYIYMGLSAINAIILVYCVLHYRPINEIISNEQIQQIEREAIGDEESRITVELNEEIKQKLTTYCEDKQLYLRQGLTREMLCREIGVNRTYLSIYLRQQGTTYYQYINTLRIRYAIQLRSAQPELPTKELAARCGFRSLPTFRKAWQEIYGTLPSER